jgi:hypothetical protein
MWFSTGLGGFGMLHALKTGERQDLLTRRISRQLHHQGLKKK